MFEVKSSSSASVAAPALRFFVFQLILRRQQNRGGAAIRFGDNPDYVE
jgi:hypothetical protein